MSVPNRRLIVSPDARHDLRGILMHSERRWDKQQRKAHVLYYLVGEREVTIVRILHGHMDAAAHFSP